MAAMVWMLINYLKNEQTTNLSCLTINQNKVNSQIDIRNYIKNDDVMLKKYQIYYTKSQPDLIYKVDKSNDTVKSMTLISDQSINTNFNTSINNRIQNVKNYLGKNFIEKKLRNGFKATIYVDKDNQIKLSLIHKDNKIKKLKSIGSNFKNYIPFSNVIF